MYLGKTKARNVGNYLSFFERVHIAETLESEKSGDAASNVYREKFPHEINICEPANNK
jgi:hypothetical protein